MNRAAQMLLALLLAASCQAWAHKLASRILTEEEIRAVIADDQSSAKIVSPKITVHVANPKLSVVAAGINQGQRRSWFRIRVSGEPGLPDFLVTGPIDLRPAVPSVKKSKTTVPIAVRRGERVRMIIDRPGMRLTTVATALENAKSGEMVRVRVAGARDTVQGIAACKGVVLRREER